MLRRILIIDDHDDLACTLADELTGKGHAVSLLRTRDEALADSDFDNYDLVITDLDVTSPQTDSIAANGSHGKTEHVKAFKIGASNFRCEDLDENELKELIQTILDHKTRYVDKIDAVKNLRENIEFEVPSVIGIMHALLEYLMKRVEKLGIVTPQQSNLFVALDEAFVNAVKHGNKFDTSKLVRITADVSPAEARFTIEDEGEGFDVNSIPDPLDPQNLFKASGRGVLFIYNIMDEVKYNERGNRLTMVKRSDQLNLREA